MRVWRGFLVTLVFAMLAIVAGYLVSCAPSEAGAVVADNEVTITAAGDTVFATDHITVSKNPDSVVVFFTMRGAPPKTARVGAGNGKFALGPVALIPAPAYADGDTATVTACPIAWKKGQSYSQPCGTKLYTRNDAPVVVQDSVVVSFQLWPDTVTVLMGDTVRFMTVATFGDGRVETYMRDYDTAREAGVQVVWAALGGKADTSRIRVRTSPNEPAGFSAFAVFSGSNLPAFPRAPLPKGNCTWCGGWI